MKRGRNEVDPIEKQIGERMKYWRTQKQYTQRDIVEDKRIPVSLGQYQKYENGKNRIALSMALAFCSVLDIEIQDLVSFEYKRKRIFGRAK